MSILIENVTKHFGQNIVLDGINLEIKTGSLVALLGGSGSGKSTLLRVVAGFEEPTTGRVWLNGKDSNILSIQEKEIGFVFQAYALFQHLTVYENIAFGLSCNSSSFELGLSKNPLVNYLSQSRTFINSLLKYCKHTYKKYIPENRQSNKSSFTGVLKNTKQVEASLRIAGTAPILENNSKIPNGFIEGKGQLVRGESAKHSTTTKQNKHSKSFSVQKFEEKLRTKPTNLNSRFDDLTVGHPEGNVLPKSHDALLKTTGHSNQNNTVSSGNLRSVEELLRLVGLEELAHRYPSQLSGGQCQRVALARALAVQPKVLLLDEPFGALDTKVRKSLRRWLRQLHERVGVTTLFVTHDHQEAMEVANEIVVLEKGRVKHSLNSPQKIFSRLINN